MHEEKAYAELIPFMKEFEIEYGADLSAFCEEARCAFIDYVTYFDHDAMPDSAFLDIYEGYWNGDKEAFALHIARELSADGSGRSAEQYAEDEYGSVAEMADALFAHEYTMSDNGFVFRYV